MLGVPEDLRVTRVDKIDFSILVEFITKMQVIWSMIRPPNGRCPYGVKLGGGSMNSITFYEIPLGRSLIYEVNFNKLTSSVDFMFFPIYHDDRFLDFLRWLHEDYDKENCDLIFRMSILSSTNNTNLLE